MFLQTDKASAEDAQGIELDVGYDLVSKDTFHFSLSIKISTTTQYSQAPQLHPCLTDLDTFVHSAHPALKAHQSTIGPGLRFHE